MTYNKESYAEYIHQIQAMQITKKTNEVHVADGTVITLRHSLFARLKTIVDDNNRKKARLNTHPNTRSPVHEMFIVHTKNTYVRPHKHLKKAESLNFIEGNGAIVLFDQKGNITQKIPVGPYSSGNTFYFRIEKSLYHCLIITSPYLVFHEVTQGPFIKSETLFAPWSPEENNTQAVQQYLKVLRAYPARHKA